MLLFSRSFIPQSIIRNPQLKYFIVLVFLVLCVGLPNGGLQAMPPVERTVAPNHLVLLVSQEHSLPFVTLQLLIDAGSRNDPSGEEGLANLVARGLLLGTSKRSVTAMNEVVDFMGASLNASSGRDYATLSLKVLKKDWQGARSLFRGSYPAHLSRGRDPEGGGEDARLYSI